MNKSAINRGLQAVFADVSESNVAAILAELNQNFSTFKQQQEQKISDLSAGNEDSQAKAKAMQDEMKSLQASIDDLATQMAAAQMNGGEKVDPKAQAYIDATIQFMRTGIEASDLKKSDNSSGGYLVPTEWDRTITDKLQEASPLRNIFTVLSTSKPEFTKLYNLHGATSGWVGEEDERSKTESPTFGEYKFETGEVYANPTATYQILEDAEINLENFLSGEVEVEFSIQENKAFISGDGGKGKPKGLLNYAEGGSAQSDHPLGAIKVVKSGNASEITADSLIDLVYELPQSFHASAGFMMNRKTLNSLRKLKDGQGNYLWQPSYQAGQPSTLMGYPVYEIAEMPDISANTLPVAFGDFKKAYLILDRRGVSILRDPYTKKGFVQFYTTKRVGGGLNNPEAVRLLKVAA